MVIVEEVFSGPADWQEFLAARRAARGAAAKAIQAVRERHDDTRMRLEDERDRQVGELSAGLGMVGRARARRDVRSWFGAQLKSAREQMESEVGEIYRAHDLRQPQRAARKDRMDYLFADSQRTPSGAFDAVLVHVPGVRTARQNGWTVYTQSGRELCRADADRVLVQGRGHDAIRAGVAAALQRTGPPLKFRGSPQFQALAQQIATEMLEQQQIDPEPVPTPEPDTQAEPQPDKSKKDGQQTTRAQNDEAPSEPSEPPAPTLMDDAQLRIDALKVEHAAPVVGHFDRLRDVTMETTVLERIAGAYDTGEDALCMQQSAGAGLFVARVPSGDGPGAGERVVASVSDGRMQFAEPQQQNEQTAQPVHVTKGRSL